MTWDLGLAAIAVLLAMSLGFALATQVLGGRGASRWLWLVAWAIYFAGGLFTSEVWFCWADEEELQPNIDGLSFDEVLLFMLISGALVTFTSAVTWLGAGGAGWRRSPATGAARARRHEAADTSRRRPNASWKRSSAVRLSPEAHASSPTTPV